MSHIWYSNLVSQVPGFVRVEDISSADRALVAKVRQRYPAPKSDYKTRHLSVPESGHSKRQSQLRMEEGLCCNQSWTSQEPALAVAWETMPEAMTVTALPQVGWFALMPVPFSGNSITSLWVGDALIENSKSKLREQFVEASGTNAARPNNIQFQHQRPRQDDAKAFAQQGGWVLTREQLVRVKATCKGFLPPFPAHWIKDNVEFYSGGFQLFNQHHCGLQRILSLSSAHYGNHLLHHVGQNKHRTLTTTRLVPQDTMLEVMQDAAYQAWAKWSPISVIERPPALFD